MLCWVSEWVERKESKATARATATHARQDYHAIRRGSKGALYNTVYACSRSLDWLTNWWLWRTISLRHWCSSCSSRSGCGGIVFCNLASPSSNSLMLACLHPHTTTGAPIMRRSSAWSLPRSQRIPTELGWCHRYIVVVVVVVTVIYLTTSTSVLLIFLCMYTIIPTHLPTYLQDMRKDDRM